MCSAYEVHISFFEHQGIDTVQCGRGTATESGVHVMSTGSAQFYGITVDEHLSPIYFDLTKSDIAGKTVNFFSFFLGNDGQFI